MSSDFKNQFDFFLNENNIFFSINKSEDLLGDCYFLNNKLWVYLIENHLFEKGDQDMFFFQKLIQHHRQLKEKVIFVREYDWINNSAMLKERLLVKFGLFNKINARHCFIERIDKSTEAPFLLQNHLQGTVKAKLKYGMYLKKQYCQKFLGHLKEPVNEPQLIAVATFSGGRTMKEGDRLGQRSFEWIRYASLMGYVVVGGMSKFLQHFINLHQPDDLMTYVDYDWSTGESYQKLGFDIVQITEPIAFFVENGNKNTDNPASHFLKNTSQIWNSGSLKLIKKIEKQDKHN